MKRETLVEVFASNLRKARKSKGLTQEQLARAVGITQAHVSDLESGKAAPSLELLAPLADAVESTPSQLLNAELFFAKSA